MIASVLAVTLAAAQPQAAPPVDHGKMDHSRMDHGKMDHGATKPAGKAAMKMDCCKGGCACCAKDKTKPAS